jgi:putative ABC transport system permease protein
MSLWRLAWRFLWSRPLVTALTLAGILLGAALVAGIMAARRESHRVLVEGAGLFDLVVGAKGSPLQLVLSTVYHLDVPTGVIGYDQLERLRADGRVAAAIPVAMGDNFQGFRLIGTDASFLALVERTGEGTRPMVRLAAGRAFEAPFEVVLGAEVARHTGRRLGDNFVGTHGLVALAGAEAHADFPYTVVGIMAPTGTPLDRAIYTPYQSVWIVHDAEKRRHDALAGIPEPAMEREEDDGAPAWQFAPATGRERPRELTAVLVQLRVPGMRLWMADQIGRDTPAMAAIPINEMLRLSQQVVGPMLRLLELLARLVVVVAALGLVASLLQAGEQRRRDIAVLRALGARPWEVAFLHLAESLLLTVLGAGAGWLVARVGLMVGAGWLRAQTGLVVVPWAVDSTEALAIGVLAGTGLVCGVLPAAIAYCRQPARDLSR